VASDEDLMERVAQGEASALEALLRRYERPLCAFLHRRTGGRDVEDLHQETWLRVVRAAAAFDRTRRFSTWLFEIAANLCRDWWRRRPPEIAAVEALDAGDPRAGTPGRVDDAMTVEALLAKLPDAQREALVLRYWHDFSEAELSRILDCPRGTVKSRIHNGLARLAELAAEEKP
jgi:RNA polymerase sigma-70 factor (ECF subfamily)